MTTLADKIEAVSVPIEEWIALHRRVGMAEGLLTGWLYHTPTNLERCRQVTREFLNERENEV